MHCIATVLTRAVLRAMYSMHGVVMRRLMHFVRLGPISNQVPIAARVFHIHEELGLLPFFTPRPDQRSRDKYGNEGAVSIEKTEKSPSRRT